MIWRIERDREHVLNVVQYEVLYCCQVVCMSLRAKATEVAKWEFHKIMISAIEEITGWSIKLLRHRNFNRESMNRYNVRVQMRLECFSGNLHDYSPNDPKVRLSMKRNVLTLVRFYSSNREHIAYRT